MKICLATLDDYDGVRKILEEVHQIHYNARSDYFKNDFEFTLDLMKFFLKSQEEKNMALLVAKINNDIVGVSNVAIERPIGPYKVENRIVASIKNLCVKEKYRNQGIGRKLLKKSEEEAKLLGATVLELGVWSFNEDAHRFYQKYGLTDMVYRMEKLL